MHLSSSLYNSRPSSPPLGRFNKQRERYLHTPGRIAPFLTNPPLFFFSQHQARALSSPTLRQPITRRTRRRSRSGQRAEHHNLVVAAALQQRESRGLGGGGDVLVAGDGGEAGARGVRWRRERTRETLSGVVMVRSTRGEGKGGRVEGKMGEEGPLPQAGAETERVW
jgi:hypothetical protein